MWFVVTDLRLRSTLLQNKQDVFLKFILITSEFTSLVSIDRMVQGDIKDSQCIIPQGWLLRYLKCTSLSH